MFRRYAQRLFLCISREMPKRKQVGLVRQNKLNSTNIFNKRLYYSRSSDTQNHFKRREELLAPKYITGDSAELQDERMYNVGNAISLETLFSHRVHLGHSPDTRHALMAEYIFGTRQDMDIINLEHTIPLLQAALNVAYQIARRNGIILFLSQHRQTLPYVEWTAKECGEYAHCRKWSAGLFTNAFIEYGSVVRLPDLMLFIHSQQNIFTQHAGIESAAKLLIPSVAVLDTNCDPRLVTYPIPGNDDTPCAVKFYCDLFREAILAGKQDAK